MRERTRGDSRYASTPEFHRGLAIRAADANVSLNRVVSDQLSKP
ncbi:toxin-antitoxin system HicB family antitoxin [Thiorhodococcus mannitoliphagus]